MVSFKWDRVLHELYRRLLGTRDAVAAGRLLRLVLDAVAASLEVVDLVGVGGAVDAAVRVDHAREEDVQHRAAAVVGAASLALAGLLEAELRLLVLDAVREVFVGLLLRAPDTSRLRLLHEAVLHRLGIGSLGLTLAHEQRELVAVPREDPRAPVRVLRGV